MFDRECVSIELTDIRKDENSQDILRVEALPHCPPEKTSTPTDERWTRNDAFQFFSSNSSGSVLKWKHTPKQLHLTGRLSRDGVVATVLLAKHH